MTFVKQLREVAMTIPEGEVKTQLKEHADAVHSSVIAFTTTPNTSNLQTLVGFWTRASLFFDRLPELLPPTGNGGALSEGARLAA